MLSKSLIQFSVSHGWGCVPSLLFDLNQALVEVMKIMATCFKRSIKDLLSMVSSAKRMHWSYQTPSSNNIREDSTHGHHQIVNSKIRLIIFFAAKDGEALYKKQDQALTVAQIMNSLLPNSDSN